MSTEKQGFGHLLRSSQSLFYVAIFLVLCVVPPLWAWIEQHGTYTFDWSLFLNTAGKVWMLVVPVAAVLRAVQLGLRDIRHDLRGIRAQRWKDHTVVCGLGDCGMQVVHNALRRGEKVVAIERMADGPHAVAGLREGVPVVIGDAKSLPALRFAGVDGASTVVICTGDDAENLDIALRLEQFLGERQERRTGRMKILVELRNEWLYSHLVDESAPLGSARADVRVFNTYETASRQLLRELPLPGSGRDGAILLVGCGAMGQQVLADAVRLDRVPFSTRQRFLVFDREAEVREQAFLSQHAAASEFADLTFVAADLGAENPQSWAAAERAIAAERILAAIVCLPADNQSLYASLGLSRRLECGGQAEVPVHMRLVHHRQLGKLVVGLERRRGVAGHLHTFGCLEELFDSVIILEAELDTLARGIHAYYRDHPLRPGDKLPEWENLPEAFKQSNRRQADQLAVKFANAGFILKKTENVQPVALTADDVETLAQLEHHRWYVEKRLAGWRYGPVRSDVDRTNPFLVDWAALGDDAKQTNRGQIRVLPELLASLGIALFRANVTHSE